MSKKNKIIISVVAVVLLTATLLSIFLPKKKSKAEYMLHTVSGKDPITFTGNSVPVETENIFYDPSKGKIIEYYVKDKDEVEVGTNLFKYETPGVKEQIDELQRQYNSMKNSLGFANSDLSKANSDYTEAKKNLSNLQAKLDNLNKSLNPDNQEEYAKTQMDIEQTKAAVEGAKQEVKAYEAQISPSKRAVSEAKSQLDGVSEQIQNLKNKQYVTEKANIKGRVYLDKSKAEQSQGMTDPLIKIVSKETKIVSKVSEFDYDKIHVDDKVDLKVISTGETQKGRVSYLSNMPKEDAAIPGASGDNSMSEFEFNVIPDGFIQYGFSVNIEITEDGLYLPESSVEEKDGETYVYMYEDGKAKRVEVTLMKEDGAYKVLKGLKLGDSIIEDVSGISDGDEIDVKISDKVDDKDKKENKKENINETQNTDEKSKNGNVNVEVKDSTDSTEKNIDSKNIEKDNYQDDSSQKG